MGDKIKNMTQEEIYKLHKKYSQGEYGDELLDLVWTHSLIVRDIALQLAKKLEEKKIKINTELVEIGVLIHDIGCYDCYEFVRKNVKPYIQHGVVGTEILRKEGFGEEICKIASVHLGVGITKENIIQNKLPLEVKDFVPETLEEKLVAYADNFHSKNGPKFMDFETARGKLARLWSLSPAKFDEFKAIFGEPELEEIKKKYGEWQEKTGVWLKTIKSSP